MRSSLSQQFEEKPDSVFFPFEVVGHGSTMRSDPPPATQQARRAEERGLDRERVEAGHVPRGIDPFDIEVIRLRKHGRRIARLAIRVQRQF